MNSEKNKGGLVLRIGISLVALGGLVYVLRGKIVEAFEVIQQGLRWDWFLVAIFVHFLALGLISKRFQLVLRTQDVRVNFPQAFYLSFLGFFFSLFFPSAFGGDIAKAYFAYQYSGKKLGSLTGVLLDRLLGFATIIFVALGALGGYTQSLQIPAVKQSLFGAIGILLLGVVFFANHGIAQKLRVFSFLVPSKKWRENLTDFYHAVRGAKDHPGVVLSSLLFSVGAQLLFFADVYLLSRCLGIEAPFWPFIVLTPLIAFVSLAPSLSGLGVREAGFVFFFKSLMPVERAFALSLVYDLLFYGMALLAGIVFAFKGGLKKELIHGLAEAEKLEEVPYGR